MGTFDGGRAFHCWLSKTIRGAPEGGEDELKDPCTRGLKIFDLQLIPPVALCDPSRVCLSFHVYEMRKAEEPQNSVRAGWGGG